VAKVAPNSVPYFYARGAGSASHLVLVPLSSSPSPSSSPSLSLQRPRTYRMMTSAYSQLFAQGLLVSAYAPRGASHNEDAPAHEPTADSKRGTRPQRRRRSSLTIETGAGPIAALRTPTQIATKALSRLLRATTRSNSKARAPPAHSHSVSLGGLGRRGEV